MKRELLLAHIWLDSLACRRLPLHSYESICSQIGSNRQPCYKSSQNDSPLGELPAASNFFASCLRSTQHFYSPSNLSKNIIWQIAEVLRQLGQSYEGNEDEDHDTRFMGRSRLTCVDSCNFFTVHRGRDCPDFLRYTLLRAAVPIIC